MDDNLTGKNYIVTGATSGIGLAITEILVQQGAFVIGIGRSQDRCQQAEEHLYNLRSDASVRYLVADLSLQSNIRKLVIDIHNVLTLQGKIYLDGLINNAATVPFQLKLTSEGVEMQWAVNHLVPFLLTNLLLPLLKRAPTARVVTVSSGTHRHGRIFWRDPQLRHCYFSLLAYANTKLANILFTVELNHRLGADSTVRAYAANPGLVRTDIGMKGNPGIARLVWGLRRRKGIMPHESALGIVYLLTEPSIQDSNEVYWKHGHPLKPFPRALDGDSARRLWELSEHLCGLDVKP